MAKKYKFKKEGMDCVVFYYPTLNNVILLCVPSFKGGAFQFFLLRRKLRKIGVHVATMVFSFRWFSKKMFKEMTISKGKEELEFTIKKIRSFYPSKKIILFGQSSGASICISVDQKMIDGLILSSPTLNIEETLKSYFDFENIEKIAKQKYLHFWEPVNFPIKLLRMSIRSTAIEDAIKNFNSNMLAKKINAPILIFHGSNDKRSNNHTLNNFLESIKSIKQLVVLDGSSHNSLSFWFSNRLSEKIHLFLKTNFSI